MQSEFGFLLSVHLPFFCFLPPPSLSLMFLPGNVNFRTGQSSKSERRGGGETIESRVKMTWGGEGFNKQLKKHRSKYIT